MGLYGICSIIFAHNIPFKGHVDLLLITVINHITAQETGQGVIILDNKNEEIPSLYNWEGIFVQSTASKYRTSVTYSGWSHLHISSKSR